MVPADSAADDAFTMPAPDSGCRQVCVCPTSSGWSNFKLSMSPSTQALAQEMKSILILMPSGNETAQALTQAGQHALSGASLCWPYISKRL